MDKSLREWSTECGCFIEQVSFVRDDLASLVGTGLPWESVRDMPRVVGEHRSKSTSLPVYSLTRGDLRFVLRDNFHDWKLSVISSRPVISDALPYLFEADAPRDPDYTGNDLHPLYFEGFPGDLIFGRYAANKYKFSACIGGRYAVWATVFEVMRALGLIPIQRSLTRAEHHEQLERERIARGAR